MSCGAPELNFAQQAKVLDRALRLVGIASLVVGPMSDSPYWYVETLDLNIPPHYLDAAAQTDDFLETFSTLLWYETLHWHYRTVPWVREVWNPLVVRGAYHPRATVIWSEGRGLP